MKKNKLYFCLLSGIVVCFKQDYNISIPTAWGEVGGLKEMFCPLYLLDVNI